MAPAGAAALDPIRLPTGAPAATLEAAGRALRDLAAGRALAAVGVASFGPVDLDRTSAGWGRILATPKPGWTGADVAGAIAAAAGAPVALDTDVNGAALAEGALGAATGIADHAYVTVGTGVGVGMVSRGRPVHAAGHPEAGHLLVRRRPGDAFAGVCPFHGACVEGLVSGPALRARLGRDGEEVAPDDPVWELCGDYLAQLLAALVLVAAPRRIVVGGGVGSRPELLAAARRHLRVHLGGYVGRLADEPAVARFVAPARLTDPGLIGALLLAGRLDGAPPG